MSYTGSLDTPPIIILESRLKTVGVLVLSIVFVALFIWMGLDTSANGKPVGLTPWLGGVLFALGIPLFVYSLIRPGRLQIGPSGFTYSGLGRGWSVKWSDVDSFDLMIQRYKGLTTTRTVCWTYLPHYDRQKIGRAISSAIAGTESALPGLWPVKPEALRDLMEEARRRWAA